MSKPEYHDVAPGSDDYYRLKIGMPSASQFHNIITPGGQPTKGEKRKRYMYRLIAERLLQTSLDDQWDTYWTRRGRELQPEAEAAFAKTLRNKGVVLKPGGFITTGKRRAGYSPDALITGGNSREALEIKCPKPETHIGYLLDGPGTDYKPQVQGAMFIGHLDGVHFFSYHPQMPQCHIVTVRDDNYIADLSGYLWDFCDELARETERARKLGPYQLSETLRMVLNGQAPWEE